MVQDVIASIEKDNKFYELTIGGVHIWDGIRYDIISYITAQEINENNNQHQITRSSSYEKIRYFFLELWSYLCLVILPRKAKQYLFVISSRFKDGNNNYDRQASPLLSEVKKSERIILEHHTGAKYDDAYYYDSASFYYRLKKYKYRAKYEASSIIADSINSIFGKNVITSSIIDNFINRFFSARDYYNKLIRNIKPNKIIISFGRFKSLCAVASKSGIQVILLQHALVFENDYALANTCPNKEQGYYPDYFYTYGTYWGQYMKHLTNVRVLGNNYLSNKLVGPQGEAVLFISTPQQGTYLSPLVKRFAERNSDIRCFYRLHPTEYSIADKYIQLFKNCSNVRVITTEMTFEESVSESRFVVGIFSTALFEALHNERPVAVLNVEEYHTYLENLREIKNVYFINNEKELSELINASFIKTELTFFEPLNKNSLFEILS